MDFVSSLTGTNICSGFCCNSEFGDKIKENPASQESSHQTSSIFDFITN